MRFIAVLQKTPVGFVHIFALRNQGSKSAKKNFLALFLVHRRMAIGLEIVRDISGRLNESPNDSLLCQDAVMPKPSPVASDTQLQNLIDKRLDGDPGAHDALLNHACDRLLKLTRKMFHTYPQLRRWEQTDDVFQRSLIRLHLALSEVRVESVRHFFNLAAIQIRRELLDLTKHHFGPQGLGANHHTDRQPADDLGGSLHENAEEPDDLTAWTDFHAEVEKLPDDEREVVNLLYYQGLTQEEAAKVLGISLRTLKRKWHTAKLKIYEELNREGRG